MCSSAPRLASAPEGAPAKEPIQKPNDNTGDKDQPAKPEGDTKAEKADPKTDKPDPKTDKTDAKADKVDRPRPVRQTAAKKNNSDCQPQGSVNPFDKRPTVGYIGLQTHDPGDIVFFREVSVRPLAKP